MGGKERAEVRERKRERESALVYVCDCEWASDQEESGLREQHIVHTPLKTLICVYSRE